MATRTLQPCRIVQDVSGADPQVLELDEAALSSYKIGAVLGLNNAGLLVEVTSPTSSAAPKVAGVALEPGENNTVAAAAKTKFSVANQNNVFEANLYHVTPASAVADRRMLGQSFGMIKVGNNWHINITDQSATGRCALIVGFHPDDVIGTDLFHRARFIFLSDKSAFAATS